MSKLHNLPLLHRTIKGRVKRMGSKCNQAKQSYAGMTDIMERGKIGLSKNSAQIQKHQMFSEPRYTFLSKIKRGKEFRQYSQSEAAPSIGLVSMPLSTIPNVKASQTQARLIPARLCPPGLNIKANHPFNATLMNPTMRFQLSLVGFHSHSLPFAL